MPNKNGQNESSICYGIELSKIHRFYLKFNVIPMLYFSSFLWMGDEFMSIDLIETLPNFDVYNIKISCETTVASDDEPIKKKYENKSSQRDIRSIQTHTHARKAKQTNKPSFKQRIKQPTHEPNIMLHHL